MTLRRLLTTPIPLPLAVAVFGLDIVIALSVDDLSIALACGVLVWALVVAALRIGESRT